MGEGAKDVLSIAEAAEELGRNPATVWRYIKAKQLKPIRPEPPFLIQRDELDAFRLKKRGPGRPPKSTRPA